MTAPNPALRISPSGPPTTGDTNPLIDYAGISLSSRNASSATDEVLASIGPLGAGGSLATPLVIPRTGKPTNVVSPQAFLTPQGAAADFAFGAGEWLVEGEIQMGYLTDGPTGPTNAGALQITAQVVGNDNLVKASAVSPTYLGPRSGGDSGVNFVSSRGQKFSVPVTITPAMVDANGGPLSGFQLSINRLSGTNVAYSAFDFNSGDLSILNGTSCTVRRYR